MTFYLTYQSFQSNRSLISGVYFTTETILNSQKVKTQKVKVAAESGSGCSHSHSEVHEAFTIKKIGLDPPVLAIGPLIRIICHQHFRGSWVVANQQVGSNI